MSSALAWLKAHRGAVALVVVGAIAVMAVSLTLDSTRAVTATGIISGILVGVAIAIESNRNEKP